MLACVLFELTQARMPVLHAVPPSNRSQIARAFLNRTFLRFAIHSHQAEFRTIAFQPFEIVEQRPVNVASDVDPIRDAVAYTTQRPPDILDAAGIVLRADSVL